MQVNILEAKNRLSKLVQAAVDGEEVVIARNGTPLVRLVALHDRAKTSGYGSWRGRMRMAGDWDSPEVNAAIDGALRASEIFPRERKRSKPSAHAASPARRRRDAR